ncbi:precorrin-4 C(11)-methyltransferase [Dehalobacterium formicoaceticum]|uniref:Precorrin-4 C(11)-methyltransferase n=1 Tax=Dehalobacterium formicoaceticum TaxID=51515 RepID=A0ABT1Y1M9_9FIRM|nr:precorrin-4 C(11)-methyltransferase [Dehalobacterium formicoaceticum]MCR6544769.1 precorrin-4 C(11)-methyltransferase [Dehalobacterium formicoaceticum]
MVYFIGAGPGDIELITVKGMKLLQKADVVIYTGSLVSGNILDYCKEGVTIYNSASMSLPEVIDAIQEGIDQGKMVVRLHTGDPSIYGAIREQMDELDKRGIDFEIIPGVSSFVAAASRVKAEFTLPGVSQTIIITRKEGRTGTSEGGKISELAKHRASMAIFLSVQSISQVVEELLEGYNENTPVAVVYKATWPEEKIIRGTLKDIAEKVGDEKINRHAQILVGDFMGSQYELSKLYDSSFSHMYRSGKE